MLSDKALREWAVIVDALGSGDQVVLLRKGGIADVGGEFRLEADTFCLWPTYLHQSSDWLAPAHAHRLADSLAAQAGTDELDIRVWAQVAAIHAVPSRDALDRLAAEHLWSAAYLDQRWNYRPDLPLYLLVLRAHRLPAPVRRRERPEDRGCKSWLPLAEPLDTTGSTPVLDDATFAQRAAAIASSLV